MVGKFRPDRYSISYCFWQVVATEVGPAHLTDSATVVVHILDSNDNPPIFSQEEYRLDTTETLILH